MFCCTYDPGLAIFLAESPIGEDERPDGIAWTAFVAILVLAVVVLLVPA